MKPDGATSARIARMRARASRRLDDGSEPIWLATLGDFTLPLPNFRWRREALDLHDSNHLTTGYGFSAAEECRLASWELGARCYTSIWARLLCLLLMVLGLVAGPRAIVAAFRAGQRSRAAPAASARNS